MPNQFLDLGLNCSTESCHSFQAEGKRYLQLIKRTVVCVGMESNCRTAEVIIGRKFLRHICVASCHYMFAAVMIDEERFLIKSACRYISCNVNVE